MRQIFPTFVESIKAIDTYDVEVFPKSRPFARINMVSSIDGAVIVNGKSGALAGKADKTLFLALRTRADLVLVGAETMRKENYGPAKFDEATQTSRVARGQQPLAPIAVVTRSAKFDWSSPFFTEAKVKPIVITGESGASAVKETGTDLADVLVAGEKDVDLVMAFDQLFERGFKDVLCEGGPSLNGHLHSAGLIDEICLTISPLLERGDGPRIVNAAPLSSPANVTPLTILEEDGFLFFRYRVD